jgi:hypothetical protein
MQTGRQTGVRTVALEDMHDADGDEGRSAISGTIIRALKSDHHLHG